MPADYLVDGILVTRATAIRAIMLSERLTREEAMELLDTREVVPTGGVDRHGRCLGEVVRKVVKDEWAGERENWRR